MVTLVAIGFPFWGVLASEISPLSLKALQYRGIIVECTAASASLGVSPGLTLKQARAQLPELDCIEYDYSRIHRRFLQIRNLAAHFFTNLEILRPGLLIGHLPSPYQNHPELLFAQLSEFFAEYGYETEIGASESLLGAIVASKQQRALTTQEAFAATTELPISTLQECLFYYRREYDPGDPLFFRPTPIRQFGHSLVALGLKSVADIRNLGRAAMENRFGKLGELAYQISVGTEHFSAPSYRAPIPPQFSWDFEPPCLRLEEILLPLRRLSIELFDDLDSKSQRCTLLHIKVATESGKVFLRICRLLPDSTALELQKRVLWQFQHWLDAVGNPGGIDSPVIRITLIAEQISAVGEVPDVLWNSQPVYSSRLIAAAEASLELGAQLKAPRLIGGFDPRGRIAFQTWERQGFPSNTSSHKPADKSSSSWWGALSGAAPEILYQRPIPVEVTDTQGQTLHINNRSHLQGTPHSFHYPGIGLQTNQSTKSTVHPLANHPLLITHYAGPWEFNGTWWQDCLSPSSPRFYLQVQAASHRLLLVYQQRRWFLEGCYLQTEGCFQHSIVHSVGSHPHLRILHSGG